MFAALGSGQGLRRNVKVMAKSTEMFDSSRSRSQRTARLGASRPCGHRRATLVIGEVIQRLFESHIRNTIYFDDARWSHNSLNR